MMIFHHHRRCLRRLHVVRMRMMRSWIWWSWYDHKRWTWFTESALSSKVTVRLWWVNRNRKGPRVVNRRTKEKEESVQQGKFGGLETCGKGNKSQILRNFNETLNLNIKNASIMSISDPKLPCISYKEDGCVQHLVTLELKKPRGEKVKQVKATQRSSFG